MRASTVVISVVIAFGVPTSSRAQQYDHLVIGSGSGAIDCYVQADREGLERRKALQLCRGASSDVPAICFGETTDRVALDDLRAVRLCRAATSIKPAVCAERLDGLGFERREIVGYCAALAWPLVPVPTRGSAACIERGLEDTELSKRELVRLCRGSSSAAPIACFLKGREVTSLSDRDVLTLCAGVMIAAPTAPRP